MTCFSYQLIDGRYKIIFVWFQPLERPPEGDGGSGNEYYDDGAGGHDTDKAGGSGAPNVDPNEMEDYGYTEKALPLRRPRVTAEPENPGPTAEAEPVDDMEVIPEEDENGNAADGDDVGPKGKGKGKNRPREAAGPSDENNPEETPTKKARNENDAASETQPQEQEKEVDQSPDDSANGRITRSGRSTESPAANNNNTPGNTLKFHD